MNNKHVSGFTLESDYEYVLGEVEGMLIQLEAALSNPGDFIPWDLEHIAQEIVSTAKWFAEAQGLVKTGALVSHINYDEAAIQQGRIVVYNDVRNERDHYYGGHHEYGYHTRNGRFIEARPYLRPAMRAVEQASLGRLPSAALEVAGFAGAVHTPKINKHGAFGINSKGYMRAFYRNTDHNYTVKGLQAKNGNRISEGFGKSYTINRRTDAKSGVNQYTRDNKPYYVRWDSPYSSFNTYKQSLIYTGNNPDAWRR